MSGVIGGNTYNQSTNSNISNTKFSSIDNKSYSTNGYNNTN